MDEDNNLMTWRMTDGLTSSYPLPLLRLFIRLRSLLQSPIVFLCFHTSLPPLPCLMDPEKPTPQKAEIMDTLGIILFITACSASSLGATAFAYLLRNYNMEPEFRAELTFFYYACIFMFCHNFNFSMVTVISNAISDIMRSLEVEDSYRKELIIQSASAIFNGAVAILVMGFVDIDAETMYFCQMFLMHISFATFSLTCVNLYLNKIEDVSWVKSGILTLFLGFLTFKIATMDTIYTKSGEMTSFNMMFWATCVFTWFAGVVFYVAWNGNVSRRFGSSTKNEEIDAEYGIDEDGIEEEYSIVEDEIEETVEDN